MRLKADDGTNWIVSPYWIADETQIAQDDNKPISTKGPFAPVVVPGKQTISQSYLFVVEPVGGEKVTLVPRVFQATLFSWSADGKEPQKQQEMTLDMNQAIITIMNAAHTWVELPSQEEKARIRSIHDL